jgi:hypothetical protein
MSCRLCEIDAGGANDRQEREESKYASASQDDEADTKQKAA